MAEVLPNSVQTPYTKIGSRVFIFGIPQITPEEQEALLIEAAKGELFNNRPHEDSYKYFERKSGTALKKPNGIHPQAREEYLRTKPWGYCKSKECRASCDKLAVRSAQFGDNVGYHCIKCLSKFLVEQRSKSLGAFVDVEFAGDFEGRAISKYDGQLVLNFAVAEPSQTQENQLRTSTQENQSQALTQGPIVYIDKIPMKYIWVGTKDLPAPKESGKPPNPKIIVFGKFEVPGGYLQGTFHGVIQHRAVCENVVAGNTCLSMASDYNPTSFLGKSVPPGVPGWKEDHDGHPGRITIYRFCPACALQYVSSQPSSWSKMDTNPRKMSESVEELYSQIEYWRASALALQKQNAALLMRNADLNSTLTNYQLIGGNYRNLTNPNSIA